MNPPAQTPAAPAAPALPATPPSKTTAAKADTSRRASIEQMFNQPNGPTPPVEATPKPQEAPPVAPAAPAAAEPPATPVVAPAAPETPKPPVLEFSDDIELDFDKPPVAAHPVVPTEELVPPPAADEPQNIRTLREQLKIQGGLAKERATELEEQRIEMERLRAENAKMKEDLQSPKRVAADPLSHPEIAAEQKALVNARNAFAMTLPPDQRKAFANEFEGMLSTFAQIQNDSNPEVQDRLINELHEKIGTTIGDSMVPAVMQLLSNNGERYSGLIDKIRNFSTLAEELTAKEAVDAWGKQSGKVGALVSSITSIDDEVIEADPHTPAAYVAKLVKKDPAYAARSEQVKQVITEAFYGRRPLTKEEMAALKEANKVDGVTVEDFMKAREKRVAKSQEEAIKRLYLAMMMAPDLTEMIKTTVVQKQQKSAAEAERLALLTATTPRVGEPKPDEKPVRAQDTPSAVSKVLAHL